MYVLALMLRQKNTAWCRFLGFFLGAGSLAMRNDGSSPSDKLVLLQPSMASGADSQNALEELVRVLGVLGWMDAPSPSFSGSDARPSFALSRSPSSPVGWASGPCVLRAACPALYDYLLPMVALAHASLSSPSPVPNAPSRPVRDQPLPAPAAEIPPAAAPSQADDWNAVTPVPVALDSSYAPSSPHRCLHHSWRFLLSTSQARALISGWLLTQDALPAPALKAEQQPSSELPPCQAIAAPAANASVSGATRSLTLRDDLVLLGALAGWQASVQAHPAAQDAWSVCFQTSSGRETSAQTAAFHPRKPRVVLPTEHQQTHVFCLTVETRNFLVRRLESHAASHPNFTHNCIEHQLGSVSGGERSGAMTNAGWWVVVAVELSNPHSFFSCIFLFLLPC